MWCTAIARLSKTAFSVAASVSKAAIQTGSYSTTSIMRDIEAKPTCLTSLPRSSTSFSRAFRYEIEHGLVELFRLLYRRVMAGLIDDDFACTGNFLRE